jgi:hypothetical protein
VIGLSVILGAIQDICLVGVLGIFILLLRKDIPYRAARALKRKLRGEFASPSPAHPAARAVRGRGRLSAEEAAEFEAIVSHLKPGAGSLADATRRQT